MLDLLNLVGGLLRLLDGISLFENGQSLLKLQELHKGSGFLFDSLDVSGVEGDGLVTLLNAIFEMFHIEVTESPIEIECGIGGVYLYGLTVKGKG